MTTRAECLAATCPCSRPEYPGDNHHCPPDPRRIDEIDAQSYRPYEADEGIPLSLPGL
jgi:hypothetical protein